MSQVIRPKLVPRERIRAVSRDLEDLLEWFQRISRLIGNGNLVIEAEAFLKAIDFIKAEVDQVLIDLEPATSLVRWIPVAEELPEDSRQVLCLIGKGTVVVGRHVRNDPSTWAYGNWHLPMVYAWADFPKVTASDCPSPWS